MVILRILRIQFKWIFYLLTTEEKGVILITAFKAEDYQSLDKGNEPVLSVV